MYRCDEKFHLFQAGTEVLLFLRKVTAVIRFASSDSCVRASILLTSSAVSTGSTEMYVTTFDVSSINPIMAWLMISILVGGSLRRRGSLWSMVSFVIFHVVILELLVQALYI